MEELDYRHIMRESLVARIKKNPNYSVRAFARDLGLSSAFLSQVLNGNRNLSEERSVHVARKMGLDPERSRLFLNLIRYSTSKDSAYKENVLKEISMVECKELNFFDLRADLFEIVSCWYHLVIVELTTVRGFKSDPSWISIRLGVTTFEVEEAIDRLLRVGLLAKKSGQLIKAKDYYKSGDFPSSAVRDFHKTNLQFAASALDDQPFEKRDFSATTFSVSASKIPKAKEMIRRFHESILSLFETGNKDGVYTLSIQFFRRDKNQ